MYTRLYKDKNSYALRASVCNNEINVWFSYFQIANSCKTKINKLLQILLICNIFSVRQLSVRQLSVA